MNPNRAYKMKKSERNKSIDKLIIKCGKCGWTTTIFRKLWLNNDKEIKCAHCGYEKDWDVVRNIGRSEPNG